MYGEGIRDCITYMSYFPKDGEMFIFPAWLNIGLVHLTLTVYVYQLVVMYMTQHHNQIKKGALVKE